MCNPVTIFTPAVSRQHRPSWRGFAAAACACAAVVCTQMFLRPFPKTQPCRHFSCKNKSTCARRAFWTNSQPSLCKRVPMLLGASRFQRTVGRVEGLEQTQETLQQARTAGSSPSAKQLLSEVVGRTRELSGEHPPFPQGSPELGFPGETAGAPPRNRSESRARPQGTCGSTLPCAA